MHTLHLCHDLTDVSLLISFHIEAAYAQTLVLAGLFFAFASGRFVPGQAVISLAVPSTHRGAYMSLVACSRDLASGLTAFAGGHVVVVGAGGRLLHFERLGWLAIGASLVSLWIFRQVKSAE